MNTSNPIERAIALAGSEAKLANQIGYSQNAVWYAKRHGRVSPKMALAIDRLTNGEISKEELRPDIFEQAA